LPRAAVLPVLAASRPLADASAPQLVATVHAMARAAAPTNLDTFAFIPVSPSL